MPKKASDTYVSREAEQRGATPVVRVTLNPGGSPVVFEPDDVINPGRYLSGLPRQFQNLQSSRHLIALNNRDASLIIGATNCPGAPDDTLKVEHGFKEGAGTEWIELFTGLVTGVRRVDHEFGKQHNATIETTHLIISGLQKKIGAPASDGTRQPFMCGPYLANAELSSVTDPTISDITKYGTGSATLNVIGVENFSGNENINFKIEAETTGDIGTATFKWSIDGGLTWNNKEVLTVNLTGPVTLTNRIRVYWVSGPGNDFVDGDYWTFTVTAKINNYLVPGAPFSSISAVYEDDAELPSNDYTANETTGIIEITGVRGNIKVRIVKNAIVHPVDIIKAILEEVDLDGYIDILSFAHARDDTEEYSIGVRFENLTAMRAIGLITQNMLYFFWVDFNKIYLQAYTGALI